MTDNPFADQPGKYKGKMLSCGIAESQTGKRSMYMWFWVRISQYRDSTGEFCEIDPFNRQVKLFIVPEQLQYVVKKLTPAKFIGKFEPPFFAPDSPLFTDLLGITAKADVSNTNGKTYINYDLDLFYREFGGSYNGPLGNDTVPPATRLAKLNAAYAAEMKTANITPPTITQQPDETKNPEVADDELPF